MYSVRWSCLLLLVEKVSVRLTYWEKNWNLKFFDFWGQKYTFKESAFSWIYNKYHFLKTLYSFRCRLLMLYATLQSYFSFCFHDHGTEGKLNIHVWTDWFLSVIFNLIYILTRCETVIYNCPIGFQYFNSLIMYMHQGTPKRFRVFFNKKNFSANNIL